MNIYEVLKLASRETNKEIILVMIYVIEDVFFFTAVVVEIIFGHTAERSDVTKAVIDYSKQE